MYQVIARKYRPRFFREVVGQEAIVKTILNSLKMKRVGHAYLFSGFKGTGKTTIARLFAKALNCQNLQEGEPCNACSSCKEILSGQSLDFMEIDGASNRGIEDVRRIQEMSLYTPVAGEYKIYLIDEVHMLTKEAFNALLKLLEEPPEKVKFFFATTEIHKIPSTIVSRCQRFQLKRISLETIEEKLGEICLDLEVEIEKEAKHVIAKLSQGALRDAEILLDEMISCFGKKITKNQASELCGLIPQERFFDLDRAVLKEDIEFALTLAKEVYSSGRNVDYFFEELIDHFRQLTLIKRGGLTPEDTRYLTSASSYSYETCVDILEMLIKSANELKFAFSEKTQLELALIYIVRSSKKLSLEGLVGRLLDLDARLGKGEIKTKTEETPPPPPPLQTEKQYTLKEKSRFDTVMRFAAKELSGSLKKDI